MLWGEFEGRKKGVHKARVMEEEDEEAALLTASLMYEVLFNRVKRGREGNKKRDRIRVERQVEEWTDEAFRRQFRMSRDSFKRLRDVIDHEFPTGRESEEMARRSSGSRVSAAIRLYITLRVLAGASYLDMAWCEASLNSVTTIVVDMCKKITQALRNVTLPTAVEDLEAMAGEWEDALSRKVHRRGMMGKTLLAGDGLVVPINCPS